MKKTVVIISIVCMFALFTLAGGPVESLDSADPVSTKSAPPVPSVDTEYADSVTFTAGSTLTGAVSDTISDNAAYHVVKGAGSFPEEMDFYYTLNWSGTEAYITQLDTRWQGKRGTGVLTGDVYWWDWDASTWVAKSAVTWTTSDQNVDDQASSDMGRFLDNGIGNFRLRYLDDTDDLIPNLSTDHVYLQVTWTPPNNTPVNSDAKCTNLDDTDNLYPRLRWYLFTANTSDADGYSDLDCVRLGLEGYWTVYYDEDIDTFTEGDDPTLIELDTVGSSAVSSGNTLNVTFKVKIEWGHNDLTDVDVGFRTNDSTGALDTDAYDVDYDVETRLDITSLVVDDNSGTIDRGSLSSTFYTSGTVIFFGSTTNPDDGGLDIVDVWVNTTYSETTVSNGLFNISCTSEATVGSYVYVVKVVQDGAGSGGADQCHATHTDTYISDRVNVTLSLTYTRRAVGVNLTDLLYTAVYQYDSTSLSGSLTLNDSFAKTTVGLYYYTVGSVTDSTHGITSFHSNVVSTTFDKPLSTVTYHWWTGESNSILFLTPSPSYWCSDNTTMVPDTSFLWVYRNGTKYSRHFPLSGHWFEMSVQVSTAWTGVNITLQFSFINSTFYFSDYLLYNQVIPVEYGDTILWITLLDADEDIIPWNTFTVYVDSDYCPLSYRLVDRNTDVNVTVVDQWGVVIYQDTNFTTSTEAETHFSTSLTVYNLIMVNQKTYGCYVNVTKGGVTLRFDVDPNLVQSVSQYVYAGSYTLQWYETDSDQLIGSEEAFTICTEDYITYTPRQPIPDGSGGDDPSDDEFQDAVGDAFLTVLDFLMAIGVIIVIFIAIVAAGFFVLDGRISSSLKLGGRPK